jgi:8-oxo-dGTP pyrophosphatase MutT (NUDIX family)
MAERAPITAREFSAGGVVVRKRDGKWWMIAIQPAGDRAKNKGKRQPERASGGKPVLALPKGIVDPGERPEETAAREVREETGVTAEVLKKLGDSKYVYFRAWSDGARVFKVVSFYLLRYRSGRIGDLPAETRHEVAKVIWIPLEEAPRMLTYKGDRDVAQAAWEHVQKLAE